MFDENDVVEVRRCVGCGCTDRRACPEGCYWIKPDLCSTCWAAEVDPLIEAALDWSNSVAERGNSQSDTFAGRIGDRPCRIEATPSAIRVFDHLQVEIFSVEADGWRMLPAYHPRELMPLFETAR